MPGGDGTGPYGTGGWCTPLWRSGQTARPMGLGRGRGGGFGRGRGFGRGMCYPAEQPTKEQELSYLEEESRMLSDELEQIKKRISELKK